MFDSQALIPGAREAPTHPIRPVARGACQTGKPYLSRRMARELPCSNVQNSAQVIRAVVFREGNGPVPPPNHYAAAEPEVYF